MDNFKNLAIISKIVTDNSIASGGKYRETYRKRKKKYREIYRKRKRYRGDIYRERKRYSKMYKIRDILKNLQQKDTEKCRKKKYTEKCTAKKYRRMYRKIY